MARETVDDETLMAYADGETDADTTARIDGALAADARLAARLAVFIESRAAVSAAFAPKLSEPVPDKLLSAVRQMAETSAASRANVVSLGERRIARRGAWAPTAIAASLALALGLGAGWGLRDPGEGGLLQMAALDDPAVAAALAELPSGGTQDLAAGDRLRAIASFQSADGALCREFEHDRTGGGTIVAIACHEGGTWALKLAIAAGSEGGYAPASSLETLDAWLVSTEAGQPLSEADEAAALAKLR
jgi:hypothetical protein